MDVSKLPTLPEVKKNIRALLISAPRGLSVEDIEHDYQAVLGKPLPYKQFKCKTALDFLKTMPDVVSPSWNHGVLILKGINIFCVRCIFCFYEVAIGSSLYTTAVDNMPEFLTFKKTFIKRPFENRWQFKKNTLKIWCIVFLPVGSTRTVILILAQIFSWLLKNCDKFNDPFEKSFQISPTFRKL